ncbi:hypothetical protein BD779DRAFT_1566770 [Infundibulicybe gibba]|nr:hypothetical protein BD779DRAFT_1566770 [Infundibulicybe gibba]
MLVYLSPKMTRTWNTTNHAEKQTPSIGESPIPKVETSKNPVPPPLTRFPPELLAEIFMEVVKRELEPPKPEEELLYSPALILTHICSQWRRVAVETPRLWSEIRINLKHKPEWLLPSLKRDMTWSKQAPLRLTITYESKPETWDQVLGIIVPQAHRWEYIGLCLTGRDFQVGLAPIKGHLHSLRALHLLFYYRERCTLDVYEYAPHLTTLTLEGVTSPDLIKLPWTQLEELECSEFTIALHAIQFSKNLLSCHLYMDSFASMPPTWDTPTQICNSNLEVLEVACMTIDEDSFCRFFPSLTLPSLQTLKIAPRAQLVNDGFWSGFFPFFCRSSKLLTTLQLRRLPFSSAQFIQILELVPCLVLLDIGYDDRRSNPYRKFDNDFIHHLNANHPGCLVPRLASLGIHGPTAFDEASVVGMVASRRHISPSNMNGVAPLQHLALDCFAYSPITIPLPSLRRFVLEGLRVTYEQPWEA